MSNRMNREPNPLLVEIERELQPGRFVRDQRMFAYDELMRYVPRGKKSLWHERAMDAAAGGALARTSQIFCYDDGSHRVPKPSLAQRPQRVSTHCRPSPLSCAVTGPPCFGKTLARSDSRRAAYALT